MTAENKPAEPRPSSWAESALEQIAKDSLRERRAARRWGIFFKIVMLAYIGIAIYFVWFAGAPSTKTSGPHTALISLDGAVLADSKASADRIIPAIEAAYGDPNTKGIILKINSPGGTAVQSNLMARAILRLKAKHPGIPFIVVVDELCASGGYYIAAVADQIYVNESSLVGSIGVKLDMFGLTGVMEKVGVERRLLTSGDEKGFLDPFSPLSGKDRLHAQSLLDDMHQQFIDVVKKGRGDRLKLGTADLFSGLVWPGRQGIKIGLVDAVGDAQTVADNVIKASEIVDFTPKETVAEQLAKQFGVTVKALSQEVRSEASGSVLMLYR
jgi:protease-4